MLCTYAFCLNSIPSYHLSFYHHLSNHYTLSLCKKKNHKDKEPIYSRSALDLHLSHTNEYDSYFNGLKVWTESVHKRMNATCYYGVLWCENTPWHPKNLCKIGMASLLETRRDYTPAIRNLAFAFHAPLDANRILMVWKFEPNRFISDWRPSIAVSALWCAISPWRLNYVHGIALKKLHSCT